MPLENLLLTEGEVEGHGADCSGTNGRSEQYVVRAGARTPNIRDGLEMSQAKRTVDRVTSSFRLWLIDRAGGVLTERRSQDGIRWHSMPTAK